MVRHYTPEKVQRERKRIRSSDELTENARDLLWTFDEKIKAECGPGDRFGYPRYYTLLSNVKLIGERTDRLPDVIITENNNTSRSTAKAAGEDLVQHIKDEFLNGYTRDTKIGCLRVFIDLVGNKQLIPDFSDVFRANYSSDENSTPAPGTILRWGDDVVPMIRAAKEWRDKALIAIQYSSGCRPMSELYKLTYGQLVDRGDHFVLTTTSDTKTGERDIRLFVGAPYLRKYLRNHPAHEDGGFQADTPIWANLKANDHLSYKQYGKVFNQWGDKADISKPTKPQHFRASRASILASREHVSQPDLENHFGWTRGSKAAAHYISRFAKETARHIAKADGVVVETELSDENSSKHTVSLDTEDDGPIAPVVCSSCDRWTPRQRNICIWCPAKVDSDENQQSSTAKVTRSDEAEAARTDIIRMVTNGELSEEDIKTMRDVEQAIIEYPDLFDHLEHMRSVLDKEASHDR